ncbi:hypothetical protein C8J38_10725 [Rhizobium sp. PP-WC-2G-219]|nr:hypothetical protein C8J38_10725 [Rhizobium sp. PP-WC-2G-219]
MTMSSQQCVAARTLAEVDQGLLAEKSGVKLQILEAFEAGISSTDARAVATLKLSLEALGIEFLPERGASGVGVRLKFSKAQSIAISSWESEGGEAAEDNLP